MQINQSVAPVESQHQELKHLPKSSSDSNVVSAPAPIDFDQNNRSSSSPTIGPITVKPKISSDASTTHSDSDMEQASEPDHELSNVWAVWEKFSEKADACLSPVTRCESDSDGEGNVAMRHFDTIEAFMEVFNGVPAPSNIINKNRIVRNKAKIDAEQDEDGKRRSSILGAIPLPSGDDNAQPLDAIAFFKDGVRPSWEDSAHQNGGGMFQFTFKTNFPARAMDEVYERLLFSVLGNGLTHADFVTGIRIADRLPRMLPQGVLDNSTPVIAVRLEVWHRVLTRDQIHDLRKHCIAIMKQPLSCGGAPRAGRTVRKGDNSTKTAFTYESPQVLADKALRRGSV